ncbi:MAG: hypothetical protein LBQ47_04680 [Endomicrobium sp.]|jgi:hypothetical protein|nr:hypothetical protein [Endomicrobium sp.]
MDKELRELVKNLFKANKQIKEMWKDNLNSYVRGYLSYETIPILGETPYILTQIGLKKGIIRTLQRTLKKIREKHSQAWNNIEDILDYIADPVAVFGSINKDQKDSIIVITDKPINSRDGDNTKKELLTVILTPSGQIKNTDGHYCILASVYGFNEHDIHKHLKGEKNESGEFLGTLKYIEKEKALKVADVSSLQGASALMLGWNNFKSNNTILTKSDIVNKYLQEKNISEDIQKKLPIDFAAREKEG